MIEFRISDTFTDSLAKLSNDEQKSVKNDSIRFADESTNSDMSFHKLDGGERPKILVNSISRDIRLIVHKTSSSLMLCYIDHHDKAYKQAERRRLCAGNLPC